MSRNPLKQAPQIPPSPRRPPRGGHSNDFGGRGHGGRGGRDPLIATTVKLRAGPFKGYRGVAKDVTGNSVRVELESQMKVVIVDRDKISDNVTVSTPYRETSCYGQGSETPKHTSSTPLHPYTTPLRDPGATPIHDGTRTPMRGNAWNPYAPMSPARIIGKMETRALGEVVHNISPELLLQGHTKHLLLGRAGPLLQAEITMTRVHQEIAAQHMQVRLVLTYYQLLVGSP